MTINTSYPYIYRPAVIAPNGRLHFIPNNRQYAPPKSSAKQEEDESSITMGKLLKYGLYSLIGLVGFKFLNNYLGLIEGFSLRSCLKYLAVALGITYLADKLNLVDGFKSFLSKLA